MIIFPFPKREEDPYDYDEFVKGLCPICGNEATMEAVSGVSLRDSLVCEYCGSNVGDRLLAFNLIEQHKFGKGSAFLAGGVWKEDRKVYVDAIGSISNSLDGLALTGELCEQPDDSVVFALFRDVFFTTDEPYLVFEEIHKKLAPGGVALILLPFSKVLYEDSEGFLSIEVVVKLSKIGLRTYIHDFGPLDGSRRSGIYGDECVFEVVKPE
jgi:hypothetical protein